MSHDPTGMMNGDPYTRDGVITGGPLVVGDYLDDPSPGPSHGTPTQGTLHCWIQVGTASPVHGLIPLAHCDFTGFGVVAGACVVSFTAMPGSPAYLCQSFASHGRTYGPGCTLLTVI